MTLHWYMSASFIYIIIQWNFKEWIKCLSKIILVYEFGQKNKINDNNYGLINLPVDGVFFKEHLTTNQVKTNYSYMQVCVWNIPGTIKDTV